jgi:hypothetical protein
MSYEAINFRRKFGLFDEQWQPKVIAEMNDYQFKLVKLKGDFIWHDHKDTEIRTRRSLSLRAISGLIFATAPFVFRLAKCSLSRKGSNISRMPSRRSVYC